MSEDLKRNPYPKFDLKTGKMVWKWRDENGLPHHKDYPDQTAALYDLLKYMKYLNEGPTLAQRMWWPLRHGLWPYLMRRWHA